MTWTSAQGLSTKYAAYARNCQAQNLDSTLFSFLTSQAAASNAPAQSPSQGTNAFQYLPDNTYGFLCATNQGNSETRSGELQAMVDWIVSEWHGRTIDGRIYEVVIEEIQLTEDQDHIVEVLYAKPFTLNNRQKYIDI